MQIKVNDTVVVISGKDRFVTDKKGNKTPKANSTKFNWFNRRNGSSNRCFKCNVI